MYLFFDTETTGLIKKIFCKKTNKYILEYNPSNIDNFPRIVQLGFKHFDEERRLIKEYNEIAYPNDFIIPEASSNVHGITTEIAKEKGIDIVQILNVFLGSIEKSTYLIGHNISYDLLIVYSELIRHNVQRKLKNKPIKLCTKELTTDFCKLPPKYKSQKEYKWPTLTELHNKLFNVDFEDAHDAMGDVTAMSNCFWELIDKNIIEINNPKNNFVLEYESRKNN